MNFKKTYIPQKGYTEICTKENCSCKRLCFGMIELQKGDSVTLETAGSEYAFIFLYPAELRCCRRRTDRWG